MPCWFAAFVPIDYNASVVIRVVAQAFYWLRCRQYHHRWSQQSRLFIKRELKNLTKKPKKKETLILFDRPVAFYLLVKTLLEYLNEHKTKLMQAWRNGTIKEVVPSRSQKVSEDISALMLEITTSVSEISETKPSRSTKKLQVYWNRWEQLHPEEAVCIAKRAILEHHYYTWRSQRGNF
jgi:hypothetical protein